MGHESSEKRLFSAAVFRAIDIVWGFHLLFKGAMSHNLLSSLKVKMCLFINSITKILVLSPYLRPYLGIEIGSSCEWQG